MSVDEIRQSLSTGLLIPFGAGAAVAAYIFAPLVPWIDPSALATFGALAAVGFALMLSAVHNARTQSALRFNWWGGLALIGFGMIALVPHVDAAQHAVQRWRAQCSALQKDMMLLKPHRTDSAAIFGAMGCKPVATTVLQFSNRPVTSTR